MVPFLMAHNPASIRGRLVINPWKNSRDLLMLAWNTNDCGGGGGVGGGGVGGEVKVEG